MARRSFDEVVTVTDEAADLIDDFIAQEPAEIVPYQLSDNTDLAGAFGGIGTAIEQAAWFNVQQRIQEEGLQLTQIETHAMVEVEAFRQISGLDLTAVILRVHHLRNLQEGNLLSMHPAGYRSLNHMASENGCSVTDLLASLDLVNIVFPYVQSVLGIPIWDLWSSIGKSKLKEMLPVLKSLVTGSEADTETTRASVTRILEDMYAGMEVSELYRRFFEAMNDERLPDEDRQEAREHIERESRRMAVEHLVELGQNLPTEELRRHLRPSRTPTVEFYRVQVGERSLVVADLTPEQIQLVQRRMGERVELFSLDLPEEQGARQTEAFRITPLRRLYTEIFGGGR